MAESVVNFLLNNLVALLRSGALNRFSDAGGEVRYITDELDRMRAFLRDADTDRESDQEIDVWVKQMRDVVYDMEDVLDEFKLHLVYPHREGIYGFILKAFHCILNLKASHEIDRKLKGIKERVKNIKEHKTYRRRLTPEAGLTSSTFSSNRRSWHGCRADALLVEEAGLVGIGKPKGQLKEYLLKGEPGLRVISVVGMGGIGKTTLVRKVYDDATVKKHFEIQVWITITQSFMTEEILKGIIQQLFGQIKQGIPQEVNSMKIEGLKMKINEFLNQKRYVIVLDDIWDIDAWEALTYAFPNSQFGSRVMVTTRHADIARTARTRFDDQIYNLTPLTEDLSWRLFCRKAFRADSSPPHLEELSREILGRCEGLPLAIVAIGGLLATKEKGKIDEWEKVNRSLGAHIEGNRKLESMKQILLLSYDHLPSYLKVCFLYLSIFPENCFIKRMKLIRLWMAEGFVERREGQMPEEIAEDYLNELVDRSLVQIAKTTRNGRVSACRVHDLLREIALSKSRELNFVAIANKNNAPWPEKLRRLSIHGTCREVKESRKDSQLRSLFMFRVRDLPPKSPISRLLAGSLRLLKVVDLQSAYLQIFPEEILKLYLLRYISLRATRVKEIPRSIGGLLDLETLDLKHADVTELPVEIRKLKKLRHLLVYRYNKRTSSPFHSTWGFKAPMGMGNLPSLQKLCFVEADQSSDILNEVGKLTQLRKLGITKLRREDGVALCSSIENLKNLRSLDLSSIEEREILDLQSMSSPPPYLQRIWLQGNLEKLPPWISSMDNLVKLRLRWSRLRLNPLEPLQALPNLVELQLREAYDGGELHFTAGGFQALKVLHLHDLKQLRRVTVEQGAMPQLEGLKIIHCELLENVPAGIEFLINLKSLAFSEMQNKLIQRLLGRQDDDYLKIKDISEVDITFRRGDHWNRIFLSV
ncbi:disease resistance protein RPM1-like [Diospyros lotus]|uniref:disease resistance protein RPM1-like n=1 Tax=Diospyros lotus TaxID=55363 RepID=UPI0022525BC3|nr:disease resistance protein RPM1-like [Diospyros lotus]